MYLILFMRHGFKNSTFYITGEGKSPSSMLLPPRNICSIQKVIYPWKLHTKEPEISPITKFHKLFKCLRKSNLCSAWCLLCPVCMLKNADIDVNRPFPNFTSVRSNNNTTARLGWIFSYICCTFVHPDLVSATLFIGMRERSKVICPLAYNFFVVKR